MTGIVVRPVRFTDRLDELRQLCVLLGLAPRIESERPGWLDLSARGGLLALHTASGSDSGAAPGETRLSFEVQDADEVRERLLAAGFADATVYDEAYGRVLTVTDPFGVEVMLDEQAADLYGYRRHPEATPGVASVVPVRFTDDAATYHRFLTALGLTGTPDPGGYSAYGSGGHGEVGVHHVYASDLPVLGPAGVHLTVTVDAGTLGEVEQRLRGAGFAVERSDEDFGSFLELVDPDGQSIQVHGS